MDPNIVHFVNKILEINDAEDEKLMEKYALSFLLFVGIIERKDIIFKILEKLDVQDELKEILDDTYITPEIDYLSISQKAFKNRRHLAGLSLEYSIQSVKPF